MTGAQHSERKKQLLSSRSFHPYALTPLETLGILSKCVDYFPFEK
jgi:hypothetical protein